MSYSSFTNHFIKEPTEHYSQLQQTSSRQIVYSQDVNGPTQVDVCFTLPPYVLPSYWAEHKLSEADMKTHAEIFPTRFFWLVCLLLGIDMIASALKPSFATASDVLISCKPLALNKIITTTNMTFSSQSQLMSPTIHIPPPPVRIVSNETIKYLTTMVYHDLKPFEKNPVASLFEWNESDLNKYIESKEEPMNTKETIPITKKRKYVEPKFHKQYIPITMERDAILLKRCVKEQDFIASQKQKKGYATCPIWIEVENQCYALVEECVMVKC